MKAFNLKEYLENPDREVVTRDGRKVRIICTDFDNPDYPVVGEIKGYKWPLSSATNGEAIKGRQLSCDLFFALEKHERWINLYKDNDNIYASMDTFETKEDAEALSCRACIATVKVEWEE